MDYIMKISNGVTKSIFIVCAPVVFLVLGLAPMYAQTANKGILTEAEQKAFLTETITANNSQVALVIARCLEGVSDKSFQGMRFEPSKIKPQPDSTIAINELGLVGISFAETKNTTLDKDMKKLRGIITFGDGYSRFMHTSFSATYSIEKDSSIQITNASVHPVEPDRPRTTLFFVPTDKVPSNIGTDYPYTKILDFVMRNAIDIRGSNKIDRTRRNYSIFVFFMERLAPDAKIGVLKGSNPEGLTGSWKGITRFQQDGWHGAFIPATFAIDKDPEIFFKILYEPGIYTPKKQQQPRVLGVYTTTSSTKLTQQALAQHGYDPGPADGIMGQKTRQAIKKFQQDKSLKVDGEPSSALLASLMGSGQLPESLDITTLVAKPSGNTSSFTPAKNQFASKMWPNKIKQPE